MEQSLSGQYVNIIDSLDQALIVVDQNNKITLFNAAAQLYTGFSEKSTIGKQFDDCFTNLPLLNDLVTTTLTTGRSISSHETIAIKPSGMPPKDVSVNVSPLLPANNTQQGAVIILHDQTRIRTLEKADRSADRLSMIETMAAGLAILADDDMYEVEILDKKKEAKVFPKFKRDAKGQLIYD